MQYTIFGLGNPGEEYKETRHNTGRMTLETFAKKVGVFEWKAGMKEKALVSKTKLRKNTVLMFMPETFMNKSGDSVRTIVKSKKDAFNMIVIHDDMDLPMGKFKISFNKSSGGHRGVESVIKAVKTQEFTRIRVGICPTTPSGKLKKPQGDAVLDFIVGPFKKPEVEIMKKTFKKIAEALEAFVERGKDYAMSNFN